MSRWDFCSPAQRFCTTWMARIKAAWEPRARASHARRKCAAREKRKRLSVFHTMSSFWSGGSKTKEQRLETALRFFCNWTRQRMVNSSRYRENQKWLAGNITLQLVNSLHQNLVNGNCPWLEKAGNSNEYNVCRTDSPVFLASLPSLTLRFQLLFDCSCLLEYAKLRTVLQSTNGSGESDLEQ